MRRMAFTNLTEDRHGKGRVLGAFAACIVLATSAAAQGNGCATGAVALANAHVRANPIYAFYFGDLETYVSSREARAHFAGGADAIRCARALSGALLAGAVQSYDPDHFRRQEQLNVELGTLGISPGPTQQSLSTQLSMMGRGFAWMVEVLPPASTGDFEPMHTPATQEDQLRLFARQMFAMLLQDPTVRAGFHQAEPQIRELAELEYQWVVRLARQIAR